MNVYLFAFVEPLFTEKKETLWINLLALKKGIFSSSSSSFPSLFVLFFWFFGVHFFLVLFIIYEYWVALTFLSIVHIPLLLLLLWTSETLKCIHREQRKRTKKKELLIVNRSSISFLLCAATFAYKVIGDGFFFGFPSSEYIYSIQPNSNPNPRPLNQSTICAIVMVDGECRCSRISTLNDFLTLSCIYTLCRCLSTHTHTHTHELYTFPFY